MSYTESSLLFVVGTAGYVCPFGTSFMQLMDLLLFFSHENLGFFWERS